jgi:hypothetical protein
LRPFGGRQWCFDITYARVSRLKRQSNHQPAINLFSTPETLHNVAMPSQSSSDQLPKNWPSNLPYLKSTSYSQNLTPTNLGYLRIKPEIGLEIPPNVPKGPCNLVKIVDITDKTHPACGQAGLVAAKDLKPGAFILEYLGMIHAPSDHASAQEVDGHAHSDYDLSLDRDCGLAIDADKIGNEARFINDYRGVAERPNAEFKEIWNVRRGERGMAVWVLPVGKSGKGAEGIRKGEEIVVSYGRGFWGARNGEEVEGHDKG